MLRVWVHGCDPGRVSDGSRLALLPNSLYRVPFVYFFLSGVFCILLFLFLSLCCFVCLCLCLCVFVDVPRIFFCPADHVPDWQPRILLGMVEARSVNVKKTTTTTVLYCIILYYTVLLYTTPNHHTHQFQRSSPPRPSTSPAPWVMPLASDYLASTASSRLVDLEGA